MKRLNKFSKPNQYICSVLVSNDGTLHEVYLNSGISDLPSKIIRIESNSGHAYPIDDFNSLKNASIINIIGSLTSSIVYFRVYLVLNTDKTLLAKDELKLIYDIYQPTIKSLEDTLGVCLQ